MTQVLYTTISNELYTYTNPEKQIVFKRFFKTGPGQYGEGDEFWGITVPECRTVANKYREASFSEIEKLLNSSIHEQRLVGLMILVAQYEKQPDNKIVNFYLNHTDRINNWDLVDLSCYKILGEYCTHTNADILYKLSRSKLIWERRIAIVSTYAFIRKSQLKHTFAIAKIQLHDKHELMHKAVGWMLREAGKRDRKILMQFLDEYAWEMPRTMLRYAIEHFPKHEQLQYRQQTHPVRTHSSQ